LKHIKEQYEPDKICSPIAGSNLFSIFTLTDQIVSKVGLFDETISPNYYYFEDNDYMRRATLAGVGTKSIITDVKHEHSGTLKSYSKLELQLHHQKFQLAQTNYIKKWNGLPEHETFTTPYNRSN
jgi:GT2 family glycosyltransferase